MDLALLLDYDHIAIQCHDSPDADTIAAGFGLYSYCLAHGKEATLFYGGRLPVSKPNLLRMLALFGIPLEHHPQEKSWPGLLVIVDGQHGAGNVLPMRGREIAVIDHHVQECPPPRIHDIRPYLGSCSTLVWSLLREQRFTPETGLLTALFYGLFMDTGGLAEVRHPLDRDLRDSAGLNERALKILKNSNLSLEDLAIAAEAIKTFTFDEQGHFALIRAKPCDPNMLGFISDLAIQTDAVDITLVYAELPGGVRYSVRSVTRESKASDIASWLAAGGLGSGGGHAEKAGGWISSHNFAGLRPGLTVAEYFHSRMKEYVNAYDIIDCMAGSTAESWSGQAETYEKKPSRLAYVDCGQAFPQQPLLHVRMLEGDINIAAGADFCLIIGLEGEVYPCGREKFAKTYIPLDGPPDLRFAYPPVVLDKDRGERISLENLARPCQSLGGALTRARLLTRGVKIFTRWDEHNYVKGEPGDWLAAPLDDSRDLYVITAALFPRLYHRFNAPEKSFDSKATDLRQEAESRRVRKKAVQVRVEFARQDGVLETLEGRVAYTPGDALITGVAGERWPVRPEMFRFTYFPVPPATDGQDGTYQARPVEALALRLNTPFLVTTRSGETLRGRPGDWLLQYASGDHGIVDAGLFEILYDYSGEL
ncbi:MAG: DHH family phosphoesterase [Desulfovibrionaceae bacterium]|nr:DHH family phosphoesterase [Desulfovibrionaceae bacterium]